ncbi:hypothetical protein B9Z65_4500 [Elsinoe australis]|uniref:Uncharacterized protein n=1 Tax=Elsinoe australis TaxID=40998 RepID=A0A2P7Z2Y7_9PEZI|nr:hypothetical protein B9Z65_4500 [Elsinoe australis]
MEIWQCSACARYSTGDNIAKLWTPPANAEAMVVRRKARKSRPCPGVYKKPHCGSEESTNGHWSFNMAHNLWICLTCAGYANVHDNALRIPRSTAAARKEPPAPGYCENAACGSTTPSGVWRFDDKRGIWLCEP